MKINTWFMLAIAAVVVLVTAFVNSVVAKMLGSFILLVLVAWMGELSREEGEQIQKMQRALDKLRSAYNELDEQAKIIIRTDLELNRTQERLDKRLSDAYILHELGKLINSTLDVEHLFAQITEPLILKLGYEKTMVFIFEKEQREPICVSAIGFSGEQIELMRQESRQNPLLKEVFDRGTSLVLRKEENSTAEQLQYLRRFGLTSLVIVPMIIKESLEGFLFAGIANPYYHITEDDVDSLFILSNQLAQALDNARLYLELKKSHDELEIRVQERTQELAQANKKLLQLNKMKSDFVSAVSHELRTPLTSIKGYAAILGAGRLGSVTDIQAEKLKKINVHSDELIKLVNDLLDIARIESGRIGLSIKPANLHEIVRNIADLFYPQAEEKHITIALDLPESDTMVWIDHGQISRVFINLIGNAMKFTPENGTITITIRPEDGPKVAVSVADTGIGVSPQELTHIFEEFYRVENAINAEKKGTGLGLPLVKRIIEAHQGKIWASSEVGKGTTFHFTLLCEQFEPMAVNAI